jgi:uncharacterized protein (DUF433 family)
MVTDTKTEHPHISRREGVCGGEPIIDGLRVTVRHVATLYLQGETILETAEALNLTEAQVFHGLSYFFDHRDEISALINRDEQAHAGFTQG